MVTFYELLPEIIPIVAIVAFIAVTRCFLDPLPEHTEIINKSEFKSLRQSLYKDKHEVTFSDT